MQFISYVALAVTVAAATVTMPAAATNGWIVSPIWQDDGFAGCSASMDFSGTREARRQARIVLTSDRDTNWTLLVGGYGAKARSLGAVSIAVDGRRLSRVEAKTLGVEAGDGRLGRIAPSVLAAIESGKRLEVMLIGGDPGAGATLPLDGVEEAIAAVERCVADGVAKNAAQQLARERVEELARATTTRAPSVVPGGILDAPPRVTRLPRIAPVSTIPTLPKTQPITSPSVPPIARMATLPPVPMPTLPVVTPQPPITLATATASTPADEVIDPRPIVPAWAVVLGIVLLPVVIMAADRLFRILSAAALWLRNWVADGGLGQVIAIALFLTGPLQLYAMFKDATHSRFGMFIIDTLIPPFGAVRGLGLGMHWWW